MVHKSCVLCTLTYFQISRWFWKWSPKYEMIVKNLWEPSWEELLLCSCNILIQFDWSCSSSTHFHLIKTDFGNMTHCKQKNDFDFAISDLVTEIIEDESLNMAWNIIGSWRQLKKSFICSPNLPRESKSLRIYQNYLLNIRSLWPFFARMLPFSSTWW